MSGIHTLDARGNLMLPLMRKHYGWSDARTFGEIQSFHDALLKILAGKGISYAALRSALTPQTSRSEAAFLFDSDRCDSAFYGAECGDAILKSLRSKAAHSVMAGDLLDRRDEVARKLLADAAVLDKPLDFYHPSKCYVIYVNNLSANNLADMHQCLASHAAYLGYVPCSYASLAKTYISMCLVNQFIKYKGVVIAPHEDDRPNSENQNILPQDFQSFGLKMRSLQSIYFNTFLSYKPEQLLLGESDDDLELALRAMSREVSKAAFTDFTVLIEEQKFSRYLQTDKLGKLENAGLGNLTRSQLEEVIRQKLRSSYVYNMEWVDKQDYQLSKFNIMLEFPRPQGYPERVTVALEYRPLDKVLRLLTIC